jgi:hypothetical protein
LVALRGKFLFGRQRFGIPLQNKGYARYRLRRLHVFQPIADREHDRGMPAATSRTAAVSLSG